MASERLPGLDLSPEPHHQLRERRSGLHTRRPANRSDCKLDDYRKHHEEQQDFMQELEDRRDTRRCQCHLL